MVSVGRSCADTVAEVVGGRDRRNDRIRIPVATNRSCAAVRRYESMLRVGARKILLQQYLPGTDGVSVARCRKGRVGPPCEIRPGPAARFGYAV
jgi:hypothetical protein